MPNQHGPDREPFGSMLPRQLAYQAKKLAAKRQMTISEFIHQVVMKEAGNVSLSSEDYQQIAQATKRAENTKRRISTPLAGH